LLKVYIAPGVTTEVVSAVAAPIGTEISLGVAGWDVAPVEVDSGAGEAEIFSVEDVAAFTRAAESLALTGR
jgi:hypothetical protein